MLNVIGVVGGIIIYLVARGARKAAAKTVSDQLAGRIDDREAIRIRFEQNQRSFRFARLICVFLALLLLAFVGRAWISGAWDGMTVYYIALVGVLLLVSVFALRRTHQDLEHARASQDT